MSLTLQEVHAQVDYLVNEASGLSIFIQDYELEEELLTLEYDDGLIYLELSKDTPVEATAHGTILMLGTEHRAYVAQQIKFEPTKE